MNIAAELNGTELTVFIEESTWKKTTLPFNQEHLKVDLVVFMGNDKPISHDAVSKPEPITDPSLMFCLENLTVAGFKQKLKRAGFVEPPYEVRLRNERFMLEKEYKDAYTITFMDYGTNKAFADWLVKVVPTLEAGLLLKRLREGGRYYTRAFAGFGEFANLKRFTEHRFELWQEAVIKNFEESVTNGTAQCEGCEKEKRSVE